MHEVGIISSILKTVDGIVEKEGLSHVEAIVLEVGELSGVVLHYMDECWPAAVYKTRFVDTKLDMKVVPGILRCDKCGTEFNGYLHDLKCPGCGEDRKHTPLSGRELIIKEIRGY